MCEMSGSTILLVNVNILKIFLNLNFVFFSKNLLLLLLVRGNAEYYALCMYVYMYFCMYACVYVCMYVCVCMYDVVTLAESEE
jgi:hypothetical protein